MSSFAVARDSMDVHFTLETGTVDMALVEGAA